MTYGSSGYERSGGGSGDRRSVWVKALITLAGATASALVPRVADWWLASRTERRQSCRRVKETGLEFYAACRDRTDPLCMQREGVWGRHTEFRRAADKLFWTCDEDPQKALVALTEDADLLAEKADSVERADPSSVDTVRRLAKDFLEELDNLCRLVDPATDNGQGSSSS